MKNSFFYISFSASGHEDLSKYLEESSCYFGKLSLHFHHVDQNNGSILTISKRGEVIFTKEFFSIKIKRKSLRMLFLPFIYLNHLITIIRVGLIIRRQHFDTVIGLNLIGGIGNLILKKIGGIKTSVYYSGDYYPLPPRGIYHYLIRVFYFLDKVCINKNDFIWYINPRQKTVREDKGFSHDKKNVFIIPVCIHSKNIDSNLILPDNFTISFLGVLNANQGVGLLLDALRSLVKTYPNIVVQIIGSGPDEVFLKEKTHILELDSHVNFCGYIKEEEDVRKLLRTSSVGIAMYKKDPYGFMQYGDSGKIKMYLSVGLPVITTDVPYISSKLITNKAGLVIDYSIEDFKNALTFFLSDREKLRLYKTRALSLASEYLCDNLISPVLEKL